MKGKSEEQIRFERKKLVEKLELAGNEVVDTIFTDHPPATQNIALWYLSKAIEVMSTLDGVVFMKGWEQARGCRIEHEIAMSYGLFVMEEV